MTPYKSHLKLTDRLNVFMKHHGLRRKQMAEILQTPVATVTHWVRNESTPPGCLLTLMDVLERHEEVRICLGIREPASPVRREDR